MDPDVILTAAGMAMCHDENAPPLSEERSPIVYRVVEGNHPYRPLDTRTPHITLADVSRTWSLVRRVALITGILGAAVLIVGWRVFH